MHHSITRLTSNTIIVICLIACCLGSIPASNFRLGRLMLTEWSLIIVIATILVRNVGLRIFLMFIVIRNIIGYAESLHMQPAAYNVYTQSVYITTQTILIFIVFYECIKKWITVQRIELLLNIICLIGVLQTLLMIVQFNGLWVYIIPKGISTGNYVYLGISNDTLVGFTSNRNMASSLLALCLPAFFRKKIWVLAPLIFTGLLLSKSWGGMLPAAIFMVIYAIIKAPKKTRLYSLLFIPILFTMFYMIDPNLTLSGRGNAWSIAIQNIIPMKPWLGWGTGQFRFVFPVIMKNFFDYGGESYRQLHNEYIQLLFEYGIIGVSAIALTFFHIIKNGLRTNYKLILYGALLIGLFNCGVNFLFHTVVVTIFITYCAILDSPNNKESTLCH